MATEAQRIVEHYDHAAQDLVDAHTKLEHSPLVLAVRYHIRGDLDLYLLEVIENFAGRDDDPPFTTEFAPNERLRILGKLHLTLASPKQLEHAIRTTPAMKPRAKATAAQRLLGAVRADGQVLFQATTPPERAKTARGLKKALGLA